LRFLTEENKSIKKENNRLAF
jgi:hypothetical protein